MLWPLILVRLLLLLFAVLGLMLRLVEFWAGVLLPEENRNRGNMLISNYQIKNLKRKSMVKFLKGSRTINNRTLTGN